MVFFFQWEPFKSKSVNFAVSNDHKWTNVIWLDMKLNDSVISFLQNEGWRCRFTWSSICETLDFSSFVVNKVSRSL